MTHKPQVNVLGSIVVNKQPATLFLGQGLVHQRISSFGSVVKDCKAEHLPQAGRFLRVGTLSGYRKEENEKVRDEGEGTFELTLDFANGCNVSREWLSSVTMGLWPGPFGGGSYNGNNNGYITTVETPLTLGSLSMVESSADIQAHGEMVRVSGHFTLSFEGADAFIFCLTENMEDGSVIDHPEYNSKWAIKPPRLLEFGYRMANEINLKLSQREGLAKETIGPLVGPGFEPPPRSALGGAVRSGISIFKVDYRERTIKVKGQSDDVLEAVHKAITQSAFTKPPIFSSEKEVRFIFRPLVQVKEGYYLFPNYCEPLLIPAEPFLDLITLS
ncbi:MAG: hypothetical protein WBF53_15410 [Litorimonas sp.]